MNHDDVKALIQNAEDTLELEIERLAKKLLIILLNGTPRCKENPVFVFLSWELLGHSPNFHIHVTVSD